MEGLRQLADESVHCVVTSPPYWGLRNYGMLDQIGLEPTPEAYVATMVKVFAEIRRVLRKDGTCWLNLGDSYVASTTLGDPAAKSTLQGGWQSQNASRGRPDKNGFGLAAKNLVGIPWRVAFALQAAGWWLRQDIIWSKPNPMPESVTDRCTKAHEYLFLLARSERYFFDADAIAEPVALGTIERMGQDIDGQLGSIRANGGSRADRPMKAVATWGGKKAAGRPMNGVASGNEGANAPYYPQATRNKRSVWEVPTMPFSQAHFATFPPALIEPCILAGTSERGCCAKCGAPQMRVMETNNPSKADADPDNILGWANTHGKTNNPQSSKSLHRNPGGVYSSAVFKGWRSSCGCNEATVPCTVLDPFFGAGTAGLVADRLGRNCIGIELNPEYAALAERRIKGDCPMFSEVTT
jgi:DNA modification methylase